jgi:cysteine desulfurase
MRIYLDNAATTPISEEVILEMGNCLRSLFGNPSSIHADGRKAKAAIEESRKKIAVLIGASIGEVFFTSGGTESNNMVLKNAVRDLGVTRLISSPLEHHCVLHSLESLAKENKINLIQLAVNQEGHVDYDQLEILLKDKTQKTLVSLMHANNEIGSMLDMERVSRLCVQYNTYLHSDTVQTIGHYHLDVSKTKIHFLSGAAHKFHGPKGVGFVYINSEATLKPFIDGGEQERKMRGGTENVYGIVGMACALDLAYSNLLERQKKIVSLRTYLKTHLVDTFEDIQFNGDSDGLYTVLSVSFPQSPRSELLLFNLDINGISASGGSACSSGVEGGSHVLNALKLDPDRKTIRFSFSHYNTIEELDIVLDKLKKLVELKKVLAIG